MRPDNNAQTLVFYDGACPMCSAEIAMIQRWDLTKKLRMIDIAAPEFDPHAWPVSLAELNAALHVRLPDGTWQTGMMATRHIYRVTGRGWMVACTGWPLLSRVFDHAYAWFARHRIPISMQLGLRRCAGGACRITH